MSWPRVTEDALARTTMAVHPAKAAGRMDSASGFARTLAVRSPMARATVHQARTRKASGSEEGVRIEKLREDAVMEAATPTSGRILGPDGLAGQPAKE